MDLKSYPKVDKTVVDHVKKIAAGNVDVSVQSYDGSTGNVQLVAYAQDVKKIPEFVEGLLENPIFREVDYTGYTYDSTNDRWNIHVSCIMAAAK